MAEVAGRPHNASHAIFLATSNFGSLDGLRCASVLSVIWHHTRPGDVWLPPGASNGFLGVDLFFVISGFLITTLLLRERSARGEISLRRFWVRRCLRIFPPYYGLLAALSLALWLAPNAGMREPFFRELPFYLTYTSNWVTSQTLMGISWSLAAEEQFYLVWPTLERFARRLALPLLALFLLVNQLVNFRVGNDAIARALGLDYASLSMLQATFTPIGLGVALAHGLRDPRGFALAARGFGTRFSAPVCALVLVALANVPLQITGLPRLLIQLAMTALVASSVMREDHWLAPILRARPVRYVGSISYGMYLYHLIALIPVDALLRRAAVELPGLRFLLCATVTIGVATVSYRLWEQPFLRIKARFATASAPAP